MLQESKLTWQLPQHGVEKTGWEVLWTVEAGSYTTSNFTLVEYHEKSCRWQNTALMENFLPGPTNTVLHFLEHSTQPNKSKLCRQNIHWITDIICFSIYHHIIMWAASKTRLRWCSNPKVLSPPLSPRLFHLYPILIYSNLDRATALTPRTTWNLFAWWEWVGNTTWATPGSLGNHDRWNQQHTTTAFELHFAPGRIKVLQQSSWY